MCTYKSVKFSDTFLRGKKLYEINYEVLWHAMT